MSLMMWALLREDITPDRLGDLPYWLDASDPRPARDQLDEKYKFAGGWQPFEGFTLNADDTLSYPDDPPLQPLAMVHVRDEVVIIYEYDWVLIISPDGFEVARMD